MKLIWLGAALLALTMSAAQARKTPSTIDVWLTARTEIAADGTMKSLTWNDERPVARLVIDRIDPIVRKWQFVAGQLDGKPALTATSLSIGIRGSELPDGSMGLKFLSAYTGAAVDGSVVPAYPPSGYRTGQQAKVTAVVSVDEAGIPRVDSMESEGADSATRRDFMSATEHAFLQWRFTPERVGGRPLASRMRIPARFCLETCRRFPSDKDDEADPTPPGSPVALDSAVRLVTDVKSQEI
jgi:hypothetical protein